MTTSEFQHTESTRHTAAAWSPDTGTLDPPRANGTAPGHLRGLRDSGRPTGRLTGASDVELANLLCAHDAAALDEAFDRHATGVAFTVRRIAGGYYVDDVVQDVFLALWRSPERFRPERGSLATYLAVVARGRTLDRVRSDGAWHRRHRDHDIQPAPGREVADAVMAEVSAAQLRLALRALPMNERVAIELAFFGGDSYRQVAVKLGVPEGTIKGRIRSGLRRLETALGGIGVQELD